MEKNIQQVNKGINQDVNEEFQPDGTYRFMMNGNIESISGEKGGVVNESGNRKILPMPIGITNPNIVGDCLLPNQDKVLFITGNDGNQEIQIIALHQANNKYLELVRTECLEFTKCDQIDCIFKRHNGCDTIIYFTDHKNRYKSINITAIKNNTLRYINTTHSPWTNPTLLGTNPNIPNVDPAVGIGKYGWDCDLFFLTPVSKHPDLFFHKETNNGNLRTGSYTFFVRLLDVDLNPTDWLNYTNPITVKEGLFNFNESPDNTDGFYNDITGENFTNKSISLVINNLDVKFQYYEIGVLERSNNTNLPTFNYRTGRIGIPESGNDIFIFNDVKNTTFVDTDFSTFITKTKKIDIVQAHTQIDSRLILANMTNSTTNWAAFQQKANDIKVEYFTYNIATIKNGTCDDKQHFVCSGDVALNNEKARNTSLTNYVEGVNYSSPNFLSYGMSLMRDEVYGLGIIYVFTDGSESPVFHIPGRPKFSDTPLNWNTDKDVAVTTYNVNQFDYAEYAQKIKSASQTATDGKNGGILSDGLGQFDGQILDVGLPNFSGVGNTNPNVWKSDRLTNLPQDMTRNNVITDEYKYLYGYKTSISCCNTLTFLNNSCNTNQLERWQYYNTAIRRKELNQWDSNDTNFELNGDNPYYSFLGGYMGLPGYFDTGLEYPDILDCEGNRIYPEGNVRHHRMPDHRIEQIYDYVDNDNNFGKVSNDALAPPYRMMETDWNSNANDPANKTSGKEWTMNDAESSVKFYPLGLNISNVEVPAGFEDKIAGYYIVRSDRTNNKTIIDKGFMNVCDTSITGKPWDSPNVNGTNEGYRAMDDFNLLNESTFSANEFFLSPTHKDNTTDSAYNPSVNNFREGVKLPTHGWWNIMELHTPKSTFNSNEILAVDYLKLESTVFGDMFFDSENDGSDAYVIKETNIGYRSGASVALNRHKYPRVQSNVDRYEWNFIYNIPISGLSYVNYNSNKTTTQLGEGFLEIDNGAYRQKVLMAKYTQDCGNKEPVGVNDVSSMMNIGTDLYSNTLFSTTCALNRPYYYDKIKRDIGHRAHLYTQSSDIFNLDDFMTSSYFNSTYYSESSWSHSSNVTIPFKWSIGHSPYMYYISLKSTLNPYEDFDDIKYSKMHSYMIPFKNTVQDFPVTGGDTFIQRFQFEKGYWDVPDDRIGAPKNNLYSKIATSTTVGFVESEINSQFRHLQQGDLFRSFPFNRRNEYYKFLTEVNYLTGPSREEADEFHAKQEITYRYKNDYSSINSEIPKFQLPTIFDYCSECSESFPNTIYYSEISLDSQVQDFYKLFYANSEKYIPSSNGTIQNLFVKNSDLYVHTENNLWKLSVAPVELKAGADNIAVGQGEFLNRNPIKLFNNKDGFSKGGNIDKFTSVYGINGEYIWLDRNSNNLFSLSNQPNSLSANGLERWFKNNTEVNLNTQFKDLTSYDYPNKGTSCNYNVGYKAVLDPEHDRYILTKKDYKLLPDIINNMIELTKNADKTLFDPAVIVGQYYYDRDGFYIGISAGNDVTLKDSLLSRLDYTDKSIAENKSWTLSYSLINKSATSYHSYIPNWTYNDTKTFYSFIENSNNDANLWSWEHNYGEFTTYYDNKFDFVVDYIYKKSPYQDKIFNTIEYTSNVWSLDNNKWVDVPFNTFDRYYLYNNNQITNLKNITVANLVPYYNIRYDINNSSVHKSNNLWKINDFRDLAVNRLNSTESIKSCDWNELTYFNYFNNGYGYIDEVINPNAIDLNKPVYSMQRFNDKYLGVRLFYKPEQNYKITLNLLSGDKEIRL